MFKELERIGKNWKGIDDGTLAVGTDLSHSSRHTQVPLTNRMPFFFRSTPLLQTQTGR